MGEVLVDAFKKTKEWKEHKRLKKEVNKMIEEHVWDAVRAVPELRAFNRSAEVVQGVLRGAVARRKKKKADFEMLQQYMQAAMARNLTS